jgi:uncharacterized alkaline shock family protein YloU
MHEFDNGRRSGTAYRLIIGLFFLVLSCVLGVILLVSIQAIDPNRIFGNWSYPQALFSFLEGQGWLSRLGIAAVSGIIGMLSIVILIRLFTRPAPVATLHIVDADDRGIVVVDSRGISTIASHAAMSAHGVVDVQVFTRGSGSEPIMLKINAAVYPGANIKRAGIEVRESVREAVESLVGIKVREVAVKAHVIETDAIGSLLR